MITLSLQGDLEVLLSAMELQFKVFRFLSTTNVESSAKQCEDKYTRETQQSAKQNMSTAFAFCAAFHVYIYFHIRPEVQTRLTNYDYFDCGKNLNAQIGAPCQDKVMQVQGSAVYICGQDSNQEFCNLCTACLLNCITLTEWM